MCILPLLVPAALGGCEPHCDFPCVELNGDVTKECGDCPSSKGCHSKAEGFSTWQSRRALREAPPSGSSPRKTPTHRGERLDVGVGTAGATSLLPQAGTALDAFWANPTPEDEAAARAFGGPRTMCDSPACARVRLQWLREANAHLVDPGANVTAGGEEVPCEFQRVDRADLLAMTVSERRDALTRMPSVISGLTDSWPARGGWIDPQRFAQRFGSHEVRAIRSRHGFSRLARLGGARCSNYDVAACPRQGNATLSLAELVAFSDEEQVVIMDLGEGRMARGEYALLADLSAQYELPEFLEAISGLRLLSLGGRPEGVQMSRHHAAWLSVVSGAKLWHVAPPDRPQPSNRYCVARGKVDYELAAREGVIHCMAHPGEVVVVPDDWWHATCNMLPFTVAIGGQTWDASAARPHFQARSSEAEVATAARWREGQPRPLNAWQARIADSLLEGAPLPSAS